MSDNLTKHSELAALVGTATTQQLIEYDSQRVHIRARADSIVVRGNLFWRHVSGTTKHVAALGQIRFVHSVPRSEPEVHHYRLAPSHHDIGRL